MAGHVPQRQPSRRAILQVHYNLAKCTAAAGTAKGSGLQPREGYRDEWQLRELSFAAHLVELVAQHHLSFTSVLDRRSRCAVCV